MKWLKEYWFLVVFILGIIGSAYKLQAEQSTTAEKVSEVKEEVKEVKEKAEKEKDKKDEVDMKQTIALEKLVAAQEALTKLVEKVDDKISKEK